jgi:predicted metalloprotease with PDZ domain
MCIKSASAWWAKNNKGTSENACDGLWIVSIPGDMQSFGYHAFDTGNRHLTLFVEKGSAAERYAIQNGFKYVASDADNAGAAAVSNAFLAH